MHIYNISINAHLTAGIMSDEKADGTSEESPPTEIKEDSLRQGELHGLLFFFRAYNISPS